MTDTDVLSELVSNQTLALMDENKRLKRRIALLEKQIAKLEAHDDADDFDDFWKLYPRKTAKKPAAQKWARMSKRDKQSALDHLRRKPYADTEGQYIPHATTYLNQERWNDVPAQPTEPTDILGI